MFSPTLQDGKKIPKWAPRARRGQFLGFSKQHSSTIALLRNLQTGYVSPQFHVVFDERFTTVHSFDEDDPTWIELFTSERDYYGPDEDENEADPLAFPDIDPTWLPVAELPPGPQVTPSPIVVQDDDEAQDTFIDQQIHTPPMLDDGDYGIPDDDDDTAHLVIDAPAPPELTDPGITIKDKRAQKPNKRVFGDKWVNHTVQLTPISRTMLGHIVPSLNHDDLFLHSIDWDAPLIEGYHAYHHSLNLLHIDPYDDQVDWFHPFTLGAKASSADTPTFREIQRLSPEEIDLWYEAMDMNRTEARLCGTRIPWWKSCAMKCQRANKSSNPLGRSDENGDPTARFTNLKPASSFVEISKSWNNPKALTRRSSIGVQSAFCSSSPLLND